MKFSNLHQGIVLVVLFLTIQVFAQSIPLSEHPRPDFMRENWLNLNGTWQFKFDTENIGLSEEWYLDQTVYEQEIMVPFPWGSQLSGVSDDADIAWYKRDLVIPESWQGERIFLTVGACDWEARLWLDGAELGMHQGGYVPFSFELTNLVQPGSTHSLVLRADDVRRDFTLYGKQGYGNARGIWQTVYLETRGEVYADAVHFTPDIDREQVKVRVLFPEKLTSATKVDITITGGGQSFQKTTTVSAGQSDTTLTIHMPGPHLWSLDDPFLYDAVIKVADDQVQSYFGMRKISVVNLPGTDYPYIALNDEPVYLQLALDQSYHPEGFYTFPSDDFMRAEIERSKSIGLNGIRHHIKVEIPRKLYWADKLGLLVMQDLPNSWGGPDLPMQQESEYTLREMIKRDYNHPSIFSWIVFNETWGLRSHVKNDMGKIDYIYQPDTQYWVASMYYLAKSLDPTRLVEDNSICCGVGHTETDINSFHAYLPGSEWNALLAEISENTFPGSGYQYEPGFTQGNQPLINSECGNVWGYEGSTGDVDWSYDYHRMMNTFRMYPKIAGWLYTEHHDVINEWNGYWRFDRSDKFTGVDAIVPGMTLNDLHAPVYLSTGPDVCVQAVAGSKVTVPLFLSVMTGETHNNVQLNYELVLTNTIGDTTLITNGQMAVDYQPWMQKELEPLSVKMPAENGLAVLRLVLVDDQQTVLHHNFKHFVIKDGALPAKIKLVSVPANAFTDQQWSLRQWNVLDGKKVNGAGSGYFEYEIPLDASFDVNAKNVEFIIELGAKQLFAKDREEADIAGLDYMLGARADASSNRNAYPMTDEETHPSKIKILINGAEALTTELPDDPADHRGVLSWHAQLNDKYLREAGSYGYLVKVPVSNDVLQSSIDAGKMQIRIETVGDGGIAVYGHEFGRYPVAPSLVLHY